MSQESHLLTPPGFQRALQDPARLFQDPTGDGDRAAIIDARRRVPRSHDFRRWPRSRPAQSPVHICAKGRCLFACGVPSDGHSVAVELVVYVVAALSGAEMSETVDELDGLDPLDLLEAQLKLVS